MWFPYVIWKTCSRAILFVANWSRPLQQLLYVWTCPINLKWKSLDRQRALAAPSPPTAENMCLCVCVISLCEFVQSELSSSRSRRSRRRWEKEVGQHREKNLTPPTWRMRQHSSLMCVDLYGDFYTRQLDPRGDILPRIRCSGRKCLNPSSRARNGGKANLWKACFKHKTWCLDTARHHEGVMTHH